MRPADGKIERIDIPGGSNRHHASHIHDAGEQYSRRKQRDPVNERASFQTDHQRREEQNREQRLHSAAGFLHQKFLTWEFNQIPVTDMQHSQSIQRPAGNSRRDSLQPVNHIFINPHRQPNHQEWQESKIAE